MKKVFIMMSALVLTMAGLSSCGNDDENEDNESAQALLIGKWRLVYSMEHESDPSTDFVEFCENGTVIFEYGIGTDDYRHKESQFVFENDWRFSEPGIVWNIYGHFQLKNGLSHDEVQRYACCIEYGSRLHFGPVGDSSWYTTPYYIRVD